MIMGQPGPAVDSCTGGCGQGGRGSDDTVLLVPVCMTKWGLGTVCFVGLLGQAKIFFASSHAPTKVSTDKRGGH